MEKIGIYMDKKKTVGKIGMVLTDSCVYCGLIYFVGVYRFRLNTTKSAWRGMPLCFCHRHNGTGAALKTMAVLNASEV